MSSIFQSRTLADIIALVADIRGVSETRRRDLLSDLRSFARMLDLPEDRILADPPWLRRRVAEISCKAEGVSRKRLSNILSNVRAALRMFGIDLMGRRRQTGLIPEWQAIWRPVRETGDHALRNGLSRGVHFANNHGVLPHEVDDAFVAFFSSALEASEVLGRPNTIVRGFVRMWNRARTERRDWPKQALSAPERRDVYYRPWDELPPNLLAQTHAFLYRTPSDDIFDLTAPGRALPPATIEHREGQIRRAASILVRLGKDPVSVSTLTDLVADQNAEHILRWLLERNGGKASGAIGGMAQMLSTVARHVEDEAAYEQCRAYLFSQRGRDAPLNRTTMRIQITKRIHSEIGHMVHPHLFRHLSAKIFLTVCPGQYEVVRRMLGHKALSSALDQYTGIETNAANRAYAKLLDSLKTKERS